MPKGTHSLKALSKDLVDVVKKHRRVLFLSFFVIFGLLLSAYYFYPRTITFAYDGDNCFSKVTVAPTLHSNEKQENFEVVLKDPVELFGKQLTTNTVCVSPKIQPSEGHFVISKAPFELPVYASNINVHVGKLPEVYLDQLPSPVPTQDPVLLKLSELDTIHTYSLEIDEKIARCDAAEVGLSCDIASLELEQGKEYEMSVHRQFKNQHAAETIAKKSIKTLPATKIIEASLRDSETVYIKPTEFSFKADKKLESALVGLVMKDGDMTTEVNGVVSIEDKSLVYRLEDELPRDKEFQLTVENVRAFDGSSLSKPYVIHFKTSGGPKVSGIDIGSYAVAPNTTAVIQLDQELDDSIDINNVVSISGVSAQSRVLGDRILVSLGSSDLCSPFTIRLEGELTSEYGVSSSVQWSHSSRMRCHTISTIGYSVRGRSIQAYTFGSGEPMLFIGAMHGNEVSSGYLMDRFIDDLEANAERIPKGRRVVVVPRVSPDGFASVTRRNANNVDLNRNFPTADWKTDVTMPGGALIKGGGGSEPLSEPESKAIADFTLALQPELVLTFHAVANNVIANEAGNSWSAAATYAERSGYIHVPKSATGDVFEYDTNGAYEDWLYEKHGIAALLIELSSMSYSQFERNKPALWAMLDL